MLWNIFEINRSPEKSLKLVGPSDNVDGDESEDENHGKG
jgi:hypothetical protein